MEYGGVPINLPPCFIRRSIKFGVARVPAARYLRTVKAHAVVIQSNCLLNVVTKKTSQ